jgi:hypothetical protein
MKYIENSEVTLDQIITIIAEVKVMGDDNIYRWFTPYRQYIFCDTAVMDISCHWCDEDSNPLQKGSTMHYKLCLDSVTYWIPDWAATVEGKLREEWEQNIDARIQRNAENTTTRVMIPGGLEYNGREFGNAHGLIEPRLIDESRTGSGSIQT